MSFDVFIQCHENGQSAGLPLEPIRRLFPIVETKSKPDFWIVSYDDLNVSTIYVHMLLPENTLVGGLSISRPCGDIRLWDAFFEILKMGSVVFYFPGYSPPLIASEEVEGELPVEMVESLGKPRIVYSGKEILETVLNDKPK